MVDSVVVGPAALTGAEVSSVLGVNAEMFGRSRRRRQELLQAGERPGGAEQGAGQGAGRAARIQSLPNISAPRCRV